MAYLSTNPLLFNQALLQQQQQQQQQLSHAAAAAGGGAAGGHGGGDDSSMLDDDSKHELMLPLDFQPCPRTVIVGRGKKVAQHPGNVRFRELVAQELEEYQAATTKAHKSTIILRVLTQVREHSQWAFVKQNLTTGRWYRVEETSQRITTAQAFRDALKDNYKSSRAFKKLKREEEKVQKTGGEDDDDEEEGGQKKKTKRARKKAPAASSGNSVTTNSKMDDDTKKTFNNSNHSHGSASSMSRGGSSGHSKPPPLGLGLGGAGAGMPSLAGAAGLGGAAGGAANEKALNDLKSLLDQQQDALVSGNFRLWNSDAPVTVAGFAGGPGAAGLAGPGGATSLQAQAAAELQAAQAQLQAAEAARLNWSFNNSSFGTLNNGSTHSSIFGGNSLFSGAGGGPGGGANPSSHSNISLSRHSNLSGMSALSRSLNHHRSINNHIANLNNQLAAAAQGGHHHPGAPGAGMNLSTHSNLSNMSGHSTGTFTGLLSQFGPRAGSEQQGNPFEPRPIPGSAAAAAAAAAAAGQAGAAGPGGAAGAGAPRPGEDGMDLEIEEVAMALENARVAAGARPPPYGGFSRHMYVANEAAAQAAANAANAYSSLAQRNHHHHLLVAAAQHRAQQQAAQGLHHGGGAHAHHAGVMAATAAGLGGNLSDHSLMSNMSSANSMKFSADEIFEHSQRSAAGHGIKPPARAPRGTSGGMSNGAGPGGPGAGGHFGGLPSHATPI